MSPAAAVPTPAAAPRRIRGRAAGPAVQPVGCRSVLSTGAGIALVAAGTIVRFVHGLDLRVVGVIMMLAGVIALLLSLLVWGPLSRRRNRQSALP